METNAEKRKNISSDNYKPHQHPGKHWTITYGLPAISFIMLLAGIALKQTGAEWFMPSQVHILWFAAAFFPIALPILKEAYTAILRKDIFNEFTLMIIAAIGAFAIGEYPEAVAVMLFYTIGETMQHQAVHKASRNISDLIDIRPEQTVVIRDNRHITISPKEVNIGEEIEIKPGERVPLDGFIIGNPAMFDTAALTGESQPRSIRDGEEVLAGMISCSQTVRLRVTRPYEDSTLARILSLVKEASERKAPAELYIRRFARIYTPIVIVLAMLIVLIPALVSLFFPTFQYIFADWLYRGLIFLVISCPCALVISVPLSYFAAIGTASRTGILFKGGNFLDAITHLNCIAFDKTGTLTTGNFQVTGLTSGGLPEEELLRIVASVEQKSTHPIAKAILECAEKRKIPLIDIIAMRELPGYGIECEIGSDIIRIGNTRLLKETNNNIPETIKDNGNTTVVCTINGKYAGALFLSDTLKPDAIQAISTLKKLGIHDISLLSGDKQTIVDRFARELRINNAFGELLPGDKVNFIETKKRQPETTVAFVGDGMNDAPVLALSDVGIAMGKLGSDASIESADIIIQTDQPSKVATAIRIGRSTRKIVQQNIIGAISVKLVLLFAGAFGFASMWGAVFADTGVALLAVLNAMRIFKKKFE